MRWMHSVGMARRCWFRPRFSEILSDGVGLVRWCRFGMWDETWDCESTRTSIANETINPLANDVGVSAVPCILFNHVNHDPP
jgi:hypothetical protein